MCQLLNLAAGTFLTTRFQQSTICLGYSLTSSHPFERSAGSQNSLAGGKSLKSFEDVPGAWGRS